MSQRTLQRWLEAEREGTHPSRFGRPAYSDAVRRAVRRLVCGAMRYLGGFASCRAVWRLVSDVAPISLVKELCCEVKRRWRAIREAFLRRRRVHVHVQEPGVLASLDSTHLARDEHGKKVWAHHLRDVATRESLAVEVGNDARGEDLVRLLERVRVQRGLPLVLATDNGAAEKSAELAAYLHDHQVVQLFNVPRTPQHNPWVERGHADLKRGLRLDERALAPPRTLAEWAEQVASVVVTLNELVPRVCLKGKTSVEARQQSREVYDRNLRARFYAAACAAKTRALEGLTALRATHKRRRLAEREAVWETMEAFELITRTRGDAERSAVKRDIIS
ncbi:MAG: transposase family protein [Phycisphaerales bacterium JB038]